MSDPRPSVVAWETTRRCMFACRHCRGAARDQAYDGELTTEEGFRLIDALAEGGPLILIFTGGEPMARADIYALARRATERGLRAVMAPCGPMLNPETVRQLLDSGIRRISLSLDGASARTHDTFRGVDGAFEAARRGIGHAADAGLEFQINTTISRANLDELPAILSLASELGAAVWDCFFLVPTGRGAALRELALSAEESERVLAWIASLAGTAPIPVKTTCAPQFARVRAEATAGAAAAPSTASPRHGGGPPFGASGCMAGRGFVFISHTGLLQPCGFFDLPCGDLRAADFDFARLYAESPVFNDLRAVDRYLGACGRCAHVLSCGGCRARAYTATGNYLAPDPSCLRRPA